MPKWPNRYSKAQKLLKLTDSKVDHKSIESNKVARNGSWGHTEADLGPPVGFILDFPEKVTPFRHVGKVVVPNKGTGTIVVA